MVRRLQRKSLVRLTRVLGFRFNHATQNGCNLLTVRQNPPVGFRWHFLRPQMRASMFQQLLPRHSQIQLDRQSC